MGACASKPKADETKSAAGPAKQAQIPDFGFGEAYDVVKLLGAGGEGETWLCTDKESGEEVAIKVITRPIPKPVTTIIQREVKILADLGDGHLNIVHADEVLLSRTHVGLVMEYVPGGNMVAYVTKKRDTRHTRNGLCLDEDEARFFFKQLIYAVQFCHKHHVAHRDLKLDNTILDGRNPPRLKLCDFGFAKSWEMTTAQMDTMRIGTPEYMGPELISGRSGYDGKKVDVWASGVLLFVMLLGMFPFEVEDENYQNTTGLYGIFMQQVRTSWRDHPANKTAVAKLTPECQDLLDKMFEVKQDQRITIDSILSHPWITKPMPPKYQKALEELGKEQHKIDISAMSGQFRNKSRDQKLQHLLESASKQALPSEKLMRVSLLRSAYQQRPTEEAISTIKEEPQPQ